jgi:hypothetical protein
MNDKPTGLHPWCASFVGIPKTKACENDFLLFFLFVGGKIQFKNSIQD